MDLTTFRLGLTALLITLLLCTTVTSQTILPDSLWNKSLVDLSVPDAPALQVLDSNSISIMKAYSPRTFAISVGKFFENPGIISANFGLEVAPMMVFNKNLQNYLACWRSTVSIATATDKGNKRSIGIGLRFVFTDGADLRTSTSVMSKVKEINNLPLVLDAQAADSMRSWGISSSDSRYKEMFNEVRDSLEKVMKVIRSLKVSNLNSNIDSMIQETKSSLWNAEKFLIGSAIRVNSNDSVKKSTYAAKYVVWLTYANHIGTSDQFMIGLNGFTNRDSLQGRFSHLGGSLGLKWYYGKNQSKAYISLDYSHLIGSLETNNISLGYEFNAVNGLWLDLSIGVKNLGTDRFAATHSFGVRLATPEGTK